MIHEKISLLSGAKMRINKSAKGLGGLEIKIQDWWDRVYGKSWMDCNGNPACIHFAVRSAIANLPTDDEVLYGKIDGLGYLVHLTEVEV